MPYLISEALVVKTWPLKEYDQIISLISPTLGKIRSVAKGIKKPSAKFKGYFEPPFLLKLELYEGKSELKTIVQAESINAYSNLKKDFTKLMSSFVILQACDYALEENADSKALFKLAIGVLNYLNVPQNPPDFVLGAFGLRLLEVEGFTPILNSCAKCESKTDLTYLSIKDFGLICKRCRTNEPQVPENILKLFQLTLNGHVKQALMSAKKMPSNEVKYAENLILDLIEFQMEKTLVSRKTLL